MTKDNITIESAMLTTIQLCKLLNVSRSTLHLMLRTKQFPPAPRIVGKNGKRWPRSMAEGWIDGDDNARKRGRPRNQHIPPLE